MALKKSDLYSSLWKSCDELRGGMDASQYKDYILTLLFVKYVSDKATVAPEGSLIDVPSGGSFSDMLAAKGGKEIGDKFNKIVGKLADANELGNVIDLADFNDEEKLGKGKEMQDRLSKLVTIFQDLDFRGSRAEGDDLLGDAYEFLMRHFATESGKSKGQFYTPAEVSHVVAKILQIPSNTPHARTVYDPTCGSGSLLIKVADESRYGLSIYGQEKDNATWALAKMNMILHSYEDHEIAMGDTLTSPDFTNGAALRTFDYAVANPPFSYKSWSNGLDNDYGRFEHGRPPAKNGDYAFLLHILKSLRSKGRAAIVLPHGVLFRGNKEADIRRNLVKQGYIKGVIGLPPNLFYGTGIPACIVVLDKENAVGRTGVFMIDASKGFIKDGAKNRLRSRDIHKIVDVFTKQIEIPRYSRMVPRDEIADAHNDYNLNIPRYIDTSEPEDVQDLHAHLHGGIPDRDLDALDDYWEAFPQLRGQLFTPNRPGYSDLTLDLNQIQQAILGSPEFQKFAGEAREHVDEWFHAHRDTLAGIDAEMKPNDLIAKISDDLLARFRQVPLLGEYAVYEQLMTYWHDVMHDDVFLIMNEGWDGSTKLRKAIENKDRRLAETPDLVVGSGRNATKYKMDLIPPDLIKARYFTEEQERLDELTLAAEEASRAVDEYIEEHAIEDGLLTEAMDDDKMSKALAARRLKVGKHEGADAEEIDALKHLIDLYNGQAVARKAVKDAQEELDLATLEKYGDLTENEIKTLILNDKWRATVSGRVASETESLTLALVGRIQELGERYAETVGGLEARLGELEEKVGMMQQLLTGRTRLPGFTGELRQSTLGEIADVIMGQSPAGSSYNHDRVGAPLINGPTEFTDRYPVPQQWTTAPVRFCNPGDVLICVRGSSTGRMNIADAQYCIGRGVAAVRASGENDRVYVRYALAAVVADLLKLQTGSTFPSIDSVVVRGGSVLVPEPAEQQRIGAVLSEADESISTHKRLFAKKQAIKTGMMQQLLTGRTHLPVEQEPAR